MKILGKENEKLPDYFLVTGGDLFNTLEKEWHRYPAFRPQFSRTFPKITTCAELKATLREGEWAWPGAYQQYLITSDGAAISFKAVLANLASVLDSIKTGCDDGWRVVGCAVNYEDKELVCADSGDPIPAAYASLRNDNDER